MEITPGWKTSEFWLKALLTLIVLPVLGWLGNEQLGPLAEMLKALAGTSPVLALVVPIAKTALFGFLAWCGKKLAEKYGDNRTTLKVAALGNKTA